MTRVRLACTCGFLLVLASCGDSDGGPTLPADTVAPRVAALDPPPLAREVSRDAALVVTFTEPINPATVGRASFLLRRAFDTVPGTYAFGESTATFIPDDRLLSQTSYSVTLTRGIRDPAGNQLDRDTAWSFLTVVTTPPGPPTR